MDAVVSRDTRHRRRAVVCYSSVVVVSGEHYMFVWNTQCGECQQIAVASTDCWTFLCTVQHRLWSLNESSKWLWFLSHCCPFVYVAYIRCASSVIHQRCVNRNQTENEWRKKNQKKNTRYVERIEAIYRVNDVTLCVCLNNIFGDCIDCMAFVEREEENKIKIVTCACDKNQRINENVTFLYGLT